MEGNTATLILTANPDSYATVASSSGESDGNSDYVESHKKLLTSSSITPELEGHIKKTEQIYNIDAIEIKYFIQPTDIFTQTDEVDPMEISYYETTPAGKHQYKGSTPPHETQPSLSYPHLLLNRLHYAPALTPAASPD